MPSEWKATWRASGSNMSNAQSRTFTQSKPALLENYRRITSISRRNGVYCKAGGTSQNVVIRGYDELLISGVVVKQSTTGSCRVYGSGPSSSDYITTTFADITAQESRRILDAWKAGTLQIKRTVWVHSATSGSHGQPYFRSGYYHDDITIVGTDSAYMPVVEVTSFNAADESRLYAENWTKPPFDFSVKATIAGSEYWENPSKLYRRMVITVENMIGESPAMAAITLENTSLSTDWVVTQANVTFKKESDGFLRGSRYRVVFTFSVGESASNITESASAYAEIDIAATPFHISRNGNGVAIGKYSAVGSDIKEQLFESAFPARFHGGIDGVTNYQAGEVETGGKWIDGKEIYRYVLVAQSALDGGAGVIGQMPSAIDNLVSASGTMKGTDGSVRPIPYAYYGNDSYTVCYYIDANGAINFQIGSGYSGTNTVILVLEYTKSE